jgi:hypothetical protein
MSADSFILKNLKSPPKIWILIINGICGEFKFELHLCLNLFDIESSSRPPADYILTFNV